MAERYDLDPTQSTRRAVVITPDDSTIINPPTRGLYIGGAGTIRVLHADDSNPIDYPVTAAGYIYPWSVKRIYATGTTATNIVAQF